MAIKVDCRWPFTEHSAATVAYYSLVLRCILGTGFKMYLCFIIMLVNLYNYLYNQYVTVSDIQNLLNNKSLSLLKVISLHRMDGQFFPSLQLSHFLI